MDANMEFDNTYRSGSHVAENQKGLGQSGRVEFNASGKAGANMFVAARASFLAKKDGNVGTDDMWIQLGSAGRDPMLGRFEAAELFPLAQDTLINHAGQVSGANTLLAPSIWAVVWRLNLVWWTTRRFRQQIQRRGHHGGLRLWWFQADG
jgi:hypothetical protein